jgi:stalled ribosome rescue protein Dom34
MPTEAAQIVHHAVVRTDHQQAQVLRFDETQVQTQTVHRHAYTTAQHKSGVRSEHEFFGAVCDALDGIAQVLVTGTHTALTDFRHYADKHRPQLATHLVGYEAVDHPTDPQLVALARAFFQRQDRLDGDGMLRV